MLVVKCTFGIHGAHQTLQKNIKNIFKSFMHSQICRAVPLIICPEILSLIDSVSGLVQEKHETKVSTLCITRVNLSDNTF